MCGRFQSVTIDVARDIIEQIEAERPFNYLPDWPARPRSVFPGMDAPVIFEAGGRLSAEDMAWGFDAPWAKKPLFNTRWDTAERPGKNLWRDSLENRRCLVPAFGFYEPRKGEFRISEKTGKEVTQQYLFTLPGSPVMLIAGVYDEGRFSLMTTEPNASVIPVHNRMPIVLRQEEAMEWLRGDYAKLYNRSDLELSAARAQ